MSTSLADDTWTTVDVASVDGLRDLLHDGQPDDVRRARATGQAERLPGVLDRSRHDAEAVLGRVNAFLQADVDLDVTDRQRIAHLFPMTVRTLALENKTVPAGTVWDLGTSTSPVVVSLGTLTMEPGSAIVIRNTYLNLKVENLVRKSGTVPGQPANYDLAVLGRSGAAGGLGPTGGAGGQGEGGEHGTCSSPGVSGDAGTPGKRGGAAGSGGTGQRGADGLPSLGATIVITKKLTADQFVVMTQSGGGGAGGTGGKGGAGGQGGRGGEGATCGCEHTNGGKGGQGGDGGNGGPGGPGGDGVPGMDVTVTVPSGQRQLIVPMRLDAQPGEGGPGGPSGDGGRRGDGGDGGGADGCPSGRDGGKGGEGNGGSPGGPGVRGQRSGAAGQIYVNESAS